MNFGKSQTTFICSLISLFIHILGSYIFVHVLNLGIYGTGLADFTTFSIRLILLIIFTRREKDLEQTSVWPDKRIYQDLIGYIKIGGPSTFMVCLDWWAWELNLFFSGYFGVT